MHLSIPSVPGISRRAFNGLVAGAAVLVSLHDLTLAAVFADQVAVMHQGQVVAAAPPMEALEPGVLRSVFGLDGRWVETSDGPLLAARRAQ